MAARSPEAVARVRAHVRPVRRRPLFWLSDERIAGLTGPNEKVAAGCPVGMIRPMGEPIGLIAGGGVLPRLEARGIRAAGREVACVGLAGHHDADLAELCDRFATVGVLRPGAWVRRLRKWGVREAVMVGSVQKSGLMYEPGFYDPRKLVRKMPDRRAIRLWYRVLRQDRRSQVMLGAIADTLADGGVRLIDTTRYIPDHLASVGVHGKVEPTATARSDVAFGWPILMRINELDIGQAIAVRDRDVIAVEAIEGTAAMIARAGGLCPRGGWTLLKGTPRTKDPRFDVPLVGLETVAQMRDAGCGCLALAAGRVILAERPEFVAACDRAGIAVVGIER